MSCESDDECMFDFEYDLENKKIISDFKLNPVNVSKEEFAWLYAANYKYSEVDYEKVGKWMIFASKSDVNSLWDKVKKAVKEGHLWHAKVSTSSPTEKTHVIIIYTVDYTDKNDVIAVLDYLETSGIKPPNTIIKYKTDNQTRAGIYSYNKQKASIYASDTIRPIQRTDKKKQTDDVLSWRIKENDHGGTSSKQQRFSWWRSK